MSRSKEIVLVTVIFSFIIIVIFLVDSFQKKSSNRAYIYIPTGGEMLELIESAREDSSAHIHKSMFYVGFFGAKENKEHNEVCNQLRTGHLTIICKEGYFFYKLFYLYKK